MTKEYYYLRPLSPCSSIFDDDWQYNEDHYYYGTSEDYDYDQDLTKDGFSTSEETGHDNHSVPSDIEDSLAPDVVLSVTSMEQH